MYRRHWWEDLDGVDIGFGIFISVIVIGLLTLLSVGLYYGYRYEFGPSIRFIPALEDGTYQATVVYPRLLGDKPVDGSSVALNINGEIHEAILRYNPQFRAFLIDAQRGMVCEITVKNNDLIRHKWIGGW